MRYALKYPNSSNLGDEIQTLAALQFMGNDVVFVPRDELASVAEPGKILLNGWWSHDPIRSFPPRIDALPISMHLCQRFRDGIPDFSWFSGKKIYARDENTNLWLQSLGFDSEFLGCLTLTFPPIRTEPRIKTLLVDVRHVDSSICVSPSKLTQIDLENSELSCNIKREKAKWILSMYTQAEMVITSRLHCALPCAAMDVPVVCFAKEDDARFTGMDQFITLCMDGNIEAAIDREKQTRCERRANIDSTVQRMHTIISEWLNQEGTDA